MIESLQVSLEGESKGRAEALRMKKKLESDIQELEQGLDHASKVHLNGVTNLSVKLF
jgi:myosin heavy chain 6/7